MIEDTRKDFAGQLTDVKREGVGIRQDLQAEMEYNRSKNIIIFGWQIHPDEKQVKVSHIYSSAYILPYSRYSTFRVFDIS
jgi:hypothetical protein